MLCCQEVRPAADLRTELLSPQPFWKAGPEPEAENTTPELLASLAMENLSEEAVFRKHRLGSTVDCKRKCRRGNKTDNPYCFAEMPRGQLGFSLQCQ